MLKLNKQKININFISISEIISTISSFSLFLINESTCHNITTFFPHNYEPIANFVKSHVDDAHVDTYRRTFVSAVTKGDRTTTRMRDAVGAERGDVERTREANNPNFIVGDLHSESHYQTSVPRARYNYAGVAQQKCIELPFSLFLFLFLSRSAFMLLLFSVPHSSLLCLSSLALASLSPFSRSLFARVSHRSLAPTCCTHACPSAYFHFLSERLLIT